MQNETQAGKVDVLGTIDYWVDGAREQAKALLGTQEGVLAIATYGDLNLFRAAIANLIELGIKASDHDYTFLSSTQWADMRAFRAALSAIRGEGK